ncbi:hypothetical protein AB5J62_15085 [Amycolatopsis sp. cg5]
MSATALPGAEHEPGGRGTVPFAKPSRNGFANGKKLALICENIEI